MRLHIRLKVKFRAMLITFAQFEKTWDLALPMPDIGTTKTLVDFNERGVALIVILQSGGV